MCRDCGKTPEANGRALDVHHTEPFRFSGRHDLAKMKALCRSCHMRADDHGRRGSARFIRAAGIVKPPSKRVICRLDARRRRKERDLARGALQAKAMRLHDEGASLRQIARILGVSHQTVTNWLGGRYLARGRYEQLSLRLPESERLGA